MGTAERKQREREQRRKAILEAAESVFIRKGLNLATMDEIAELAELSKGTLYLYFKSKEDMFVHIMINCMDIYIGILRRNMAKYTEYQDRLASVGESYLEFYKHHPSQFKLMNHMDEHDDKEFSNTELSYQLLERNNTIWNIVEDIIQEGKDLGLFRPDTDPLEVGISLWATSTGLIQMMGHICHFKKDIPQYLAEKGLFERVVRIHTFDYEKMLRQVWEAVFQQIRVKTS